MRKFHIIQIGKSCYCTHGNVDIFLFQKVDSKG